MSKLAEINTYSVEQTVDTSGVTDQKSIRKEELAEIASEMAAAGYSYAYGQDDAELMAVFDYSYSEIRYATDKNAVNIASMILQETEKRIDELQEEMVAAEDLQELKERLKQFQVLTVKQEGMMSSGVAGTKRMAVLFREMDELLSKRLDKLMYKIKRKEPVLFDTYSNAREIRDLGRRKRETPATEAV